MEIQITKGIYPSISQLTILKRTCESTFDFQAVAIATFLGIKILKISKRYRETGIDSTRSKQD